MLYRPLLMTATVDTGLPVPVQEPFAKMLYVTVPLAATSDVQAGSVQLVVRMAESVTDPPTVIVVDERLVVRIGGPGSTLSGSHGLIAAGLFASPLYLAWKPKAPVKLKTTGLLLGTTRLVTVTTETTVAAELQLPP
jgi:hypothetical protein